VTQRIGQIQRLFRALTGAALTLVLVQCSATSYIDHQVTLSDPPARQADIPIAARREHQRILAAYGGLYESPQLEAELNDIVAKLVAASERPDMHYRVIILNAPGVNAFALPTGQIYVTRGLLALANDKAELASVLSHEMAHVIARHAAIREDQARQVALVNQATPELLADPQKGALALAKSKIALASFSRAQEFEADGIGVGIAARAGYDPYGATRFLTAMGRNAELRAALTKIDPQGYEFLSSHPATPERVTNATLNARQFSRAEPGIRDKDRYLPLLDGLVQDEDPSEGLVRGRKFFHPKLGFTFTAPDGFMLDNTPRAVFGMKDSGEQALRLDVVRIPAEQKLTDYLQSGWMDNIDPGSIEETTINGLATARASADGEPWSFRIYAIRFGSDVYRFIFAAREFSPARERGVRDTVNSFRRMTLAEMKSAQARRLKIVTVGARDTVASLAARMAYPDRQVERFRILNGLNAADKLTPGDLVKIVVE